MILFEDPDLLVVNKPEGIASIPERDTGVASLSVQLSEQRGERLWVVHRLDKEVSGVLLFARTAAMHRTLSLLFESRAVNKLYLAAVQGVVATNSGSMSDPIRAFGSGRMGVDRKRGKPARTEFTVRARGEGHSLLEVRPITGRRHQIRVHLYTLGHPVAGDPRYGAPATQQGYPRVLLHAWKLHVALPNGRTLDFAAPPPPSFVDALAPLGLAGGCPTS